MSKLLLLLVMLLSLLLTIQGDSQAADRSTAAVQQSITQNEAKNEPATTDHVKNDADEFTGSSSSELLDSAKKSHPSYGTADIVYTVADAVSDKVSGAANNVAEAVQHVADSNTDKPTQRVKESLSQNAAHVEPAVTDHVVNEQGEFGGSSSNEPVSVPATPLKKEASREQKPAAQAIDSSAATSTDAAQQRAQFKKLDSAAKASNKASGKAKKSNKATTVNKQLSRQRQQSEQKQRRRLQAQSTKAETLAKKFASSEKKLDDKLLRVLNRRFTELNQLATETALILGTEDVFRSYVFDTPRPYYTFVVFQAKAPQYNCGICGPVHDATVQLAEQLQVYRSEHNMSFETLNLNKLKTLPVYVIEFDIENNQQLFQQLGLNSAPMIYLIPPTLSTAAENKELSKYIDSIPSKYKFTTLTPSINVGDFTKFVERHLAYKLSAQREVEKSATALINTLIDSFAAFLDKIVMHASRPFALLLPQTAAVFIATVIVYGVPGATAAALFYLVFVSERSIFDRDYSHTVQTLLQRYYQPIVLVLLFLYSQATSGFMHNIIRENPPYHTDGSGKRNYFSGEFMGQTQYEGYIVGALQLALGLLVVSAVLRAQKHVRISEKSTANSIYDTVDYVVSWLTSPLIVLCIALYLWYNLVSIFSQKNGGYNKGWLWWYGSWEHFWHATTEQLRIPRSSVYAVVNPLNKQWRVVLKFARQYLPAYVFAWL